jgi:hypothetical protein
MFYLHLLAQQDDFLRGHLNESFDCSFHVDYESAGQLWTQASMQAVQMAQSAAASLHKQAGMGGSQVGGSHDTVVDRMAGGLVSEAAPVEGDRQQRQISTWQQTRLIGSSNSAGTKQQRQSQGRRLLLTH